MKPSVATNDTVSSRLPSQRGPQSNQCFHSKEKPEFQMPRPKMRSPLKKFRRLSSPRSVRSSFQEEDGRESSSGASKRRLAKTRENTLEEPTVHIVTPRIRSLEAERRNNVPSIIGDSIKELVSLVPSASHWLHLLVLILGGIICLAQPLIVVVGFPVLIVIKICCRVVMCAAENLNPMRRIPWIYRMAKDELSNVKEGKGQTKYLMALSKSPMIFRTTKQWVFYEIDRKKLALKKRKAVTKD